MLSIESCIETNKKNMPMLKRFQSDVDMRKCYLPCGVLLNCCILKTS